MATIELNRRFFIWEKDSDTVAEDLWPGYTNLLSWSDVRNHRRVVILAEGGSGKTTELESQAELLAGQGKYAFYAALQSVARSGLDAALDEAPRSSLRAWRESAEPAWFFIDSIDEAKAERIHLDDALRKIADGFEGCSERAFIVLSGRPAEWEAERDTNLLLKALPLPDPEAPPPPPLRTLVRRMLKIEKTPEPPAKEVPLILRMARLDDAQMHQYAATKGVVDVDAFLEALRAANLESTGRRPLDLDWLARYWIAHRGIGNLQAMVSESLRERLKEPNPDRNRYDRLSEDAAMRGLERVGAALVFGRKKTLAIPDRGASALGAEDALDLDEVLQDWSGHERASLLNRAVFDPAALGQVRLHNDNDDAVSSYLTAQWLRRLRCANLSGRQLAGLLFANGYGLDLIRPSMRPTAAWLSIWDGDIAREVIRREPVVLLLFGDPASLPAHVRAAALKAVVERIGAGEETPTTDSIALTRFAQPDIASTVRQIWEADSANVEVRCLLLKLIASGALRDCADIAASAAFDEFDDKRTTYLGARALVAAADGNQLAAYAGHIMSTIASVHNDVLMSAIEDLFPTFISVDDLLAIFEAGRFEENNQRGISLKWSSRDLVEKLTNPAELERLIRGLMALNAARPVIDGVYPGERNDTLEFVLAAAAMRLLAITPRDAPAVVAIDAVLSLCSPLGLPISPQNESLSSAILKLHATRESRRAAFWRAAQTLQAGQKAARGPVKSLLDMTSAGWNPALKPEDLDWLLVDGPSREAGEQGLAASAAMNLRETHGEDPDVIARIENAAAQWPAMHTEVEARRRLTATTPEFEERKRRIAEMKAAREQRLTEDEDNRVNFVEQLRSDPDPLSRLRPPTAGAIPPALQDLWSLLLEASHTSTRHAIASVAPLVELAGVKVADAFAQAARQVWRERKPMLMSERAPTARTNVDRHDILGLAGVSIEAASNDSWAGLLSEPEAQRAAQYATLEINQLPPWITSLAQAWPTPVRNVLMGEVRCDLGMADDQARGQLLDHIERAGQELANVMAEPLWREVQSRNVIGLANLQSLISIVMRGLPPAARQGAYELAIERFRASEKPSIAAQYLRLAAAFDAAGATQALVEKLTTLDGARKTALVLPVLPQLFGSRLALMPGRAGEIDVPTLKQLVLIAYGGVRVEDDRDHSDGQSFSPSPRDIAEEARSRVFDRLVQTPGPEAYAALLELRTEPVFATRAQHIAALAQQRAAVDAEASAWERDAALLFERRYEKEPATGPELQTLAIDRLEDIQHDLLNSDFAQGPTLSALPDEAAVQSWLADRLRLVQGWSYSVEREPETVAAKKPDIVLTARAGAVKVPVEIKVAGEWSVRQLEDALAAQLCGQYLRARDCREGLLVLVYQKPRPYGWRLPKGGKLNFAQLVDRLKDQASRIRQADPSGPRPEIVVVDVSNCARPKKRRKAPAQKGAVKQPAAKKSTPKKAITKKAAPKKSSEKASAGATRRATPAAGKRARAAS